MGTGKRVELGRTLAVFLGAPLLLNGLIFGLGWDRDRTGGPGEIAGLPPGWVVGSIWMLLFAAMGVARWLLMRGARDAREAKIAEMPSVLAIVCLLYPFYTAGLSNDRIGVAGTVVTLAFAVTVAGVSGRRSFVACGCLVTVCLWLAYAGVVTGLALR